MRRTPDSSPKLLSDMSLRCLIQASGKQRHHHRADPEHKHPQSTRGAVFELGIDLGPEALKLGIANTMNSPSGASASSSV
jgi:hypothetical protein